MSDPKGNKTVYDYTPDGQLEQQVCYAAGQLQQPETTITYAYHRSGQLASYSDGTHGASYTYTATGQLQSETTQFGPFSKSVAYGYHDNGDLKYYTDPEGRTLEYHYDANRQLEAINLPNVGLYTVNSHRWFAPEQVTLPGGSVQKRSYDGFMQLTGIEVNDPGKNRQMHYQYQYDKVGNITGKATEHGAYVYQYDDLYRLIEAQNPNSDTETFTYDPVGNRLTTQASPTPWIYNANHALQSRPEAISYGYDANGSTTQITRNGQTTQLIYNAANRLSEIKDHANQSVASYRYDPFGRRISKTVHGDTTYFLYSPQGLIGEYTATGSLIRGYGYKPGGHWMTDPLYLKTGSTREQHFFYQNDHLGTPQKLMSTTGAIVWDARYEAFGKATPIPLLPGVQPVDNPLRFAGQYHDPETGWHYNWHRYYAPELGRYITSDPIGLEGGVNTYGYVGGNPVNASDPMGLAEVVITYVDGRVASFVDPGSARIAEAIAASSPSSIQKLDFLGHGSRDLIEVGQGDLLSRTSSGGVLLGTDNFPDMVRTKLASNAEIVLYGCETARDWPWQDEGSHIAQNLSNQLPGITVWGSRGYVLSTHQAAGFYLGGSSRFGIMKSYRNGIYQNSQVEARF